MKKNKEIWLNLGSGVSLADNFINVDNFFDLEDLKHGAKVKEGEYQNARVPAGVKFIRGDLCALPFPDNYADYIECNDVIEHMPTGKVLVALKEIYRVLKPGCKLGLSTTNFDELARIWTKEITGNSLSTQKDWDKCVTLTQVIYGNQAGEGEFHKTPFNPFILGYQLQAAGFKLKDITINIYPTNSPFVPPQKAYKHDAERLKGAVILTEMMWAECIK